MAAPDAGYPILVRRYTGDQATTIVCVSCDAEAVISGDDLLNDDCYECPADTALARCGSSARRCRGLAQMKYVEGDECKNCGALDYGMPDGLEGCCSRACMLQVEYAKSIGGERHAA